MALVSAKMKLILAVASMQCGLVKSKSHEVTAIFRHKKNVRHLLLVGILLWRMTVRDGPERFDHFMLIYLCTFDHIL